MNLQLYSAKRPSFFRMHAREWQRKARRALGRLGDVLLGLLLLGAAAAILWIVAEALLEPRAPAGTGAGLSAPLPQPLATALGLSPRILRTDRLHLSPLAHRVSRIHDERVAFLDAP